MKASWAPEVLDAHAGPQVQTLQSKVATEEPLLLCNAHTR